MRASRHDLVLGLRTWGTGAVALAGLALAGCGLGTGKAPSAIKLTVTSDFGAHVIHSWGAPRVRGQATVMSLLMRNTTVGTRFGGGFVESIDGLSGGAGGRTIDWFYYVNGVEAPKGAAATNVHPGDHIWWDRHDWSQADFVPAVVGSFPEPFLNGTEGKRLPVRVECAGPSSAPCRTVVSRLRALKITAGEAAIGPGQTPHSLRILVGPWSAVGGVPGGRAIERGPRASGVYARFSHAGTTLTLLDGHGASAHTLAAGAGLIAATRYEGGAPLWFITGTDDAGVEAAARAFDESELRDRFALALAPGGAALPVPVGEGAA